MFKVWALVTEIVPTRWQHLRIRFLEACLHTADAAIIATWKKINTRWTWFSNTDNSSLSMTRTWWSLNQRQNSFIQSKSHVCLSLMSFFFCIVNKIVFISTTLKAYSAVCWKTSYIHVRRGANSATVLKDSVCWEGINESVHTHLVLPSALLGLFIFYRPLRMHELLSQA